MEWIIGAKYLVSSPRKITVNGGVVVEGDTIVDLGDYDKLKSKYRRYEKIYQKRGVITPGLINSHTHAAMTILRGYADDLPLHVWLEKHIFPIERLLTEEDVYIGAKLAAIEAAMGGCTVLNTMYHYAHMEAKAIEEVGLRGTIGHVCFEWRREEDIKTTKELCRRWHGEGGGRIRVSVDPHAPYTVSPEYLIELHELRKELNSQYGDKGDIITHIHLAETKQEMNKIRESFRENEYVRSSGTPVSYLYKLGVLDDYVVAAHCVAVSEDDIKILSEQRVSILHNPVSNLKLASGFAPIPELCKWNVNVALGTDGACSNNSLDMIETMKFAALIHKGFQLDPTVAKAEEVFEMATIGGAKALRLEKIGEIRVGWKADLVLWDFNKPHLTPIYDPISHLVYASKYGDVSSTMVDGNWIVWNRTPQTVNLDELIKKVYNTKAKLIEAMEGN